MSEQDNTPKKHTIIALVENRPGVLNRVVSLFRRRNYNVDSLTVGRTHRSHLSRMTIVVDALKAPPKQIVANLYKLVNVVEVREISEDLYVSRDLALIKVRTDDASSYNLVTEICERFPARLVDIGTKVSIVECTARAEVIEELIDALRPIGIVEMVRTGIVAMGRGVRILDSDYQPQVRAAPAALNGERYSV
ncbi:MAG TPA: acetolactate synthase small subunit [Aggregatilineales bacterium]|jgi:acetolactate synthase-1/3 small subunit|nr:acetolactate synthase small subunit [Aggregatilineales bacterium]